MAQQISVPTAEDVAPPPPAPAPVVPLARLLTLAALNPAQAVLVAARVLAGVEQAASDPAAPEGPLAWRVDVDPRGGIEVTRVRAVEGLEVDELLAQLTRNARRLPAHPSAEQLWLLQTLEEVGARSDGRPAERVGELERALDERLGPHARQRLQREVGALVEAYAHVTAGRVAAVAPPSARARRTVQQRAVPAPRRAPSRRLVRGALLLVALLVVVSGFLVLRDPGGGDVDAVADEPVTATTRTPRDQARRPETPRRPATARLAARRSAEVDSVTVEPGPGCRPGAPCSVTTTVRLPAAATARSVVWRVGTARWCGGRVTWSAPVTVTAQPGWTSVYATTSVTAADGEAVSLVALTTAPSRVQSPPVPTAGRLPACSSGDAQR